jgi:hypothetical protein
MLKLPVAGHPELEIFTVYERGGVTSALGIVSYAAKKTY